MSAKGSEDWSDDRHQTAYEEGRAVIEAQNATMTDIDDKAMRAVRLTTVIIGLLVAGLQFDQSLFDPLLLQFAFGALVIALIAGIITYDESNLYVGPDGDYLEALADGTDFPTAWDEHLSVTFAGMISENAIIVRKNSLYLSLMNGAMVLGIGLAVVAVVI